MKDLEVEVIRNTIHKITPNKAVQLPIVYLSSEDDKIDKWRLDSVNTKNQKIIDSLGLEIWLYEKLVIIDSNILKLLQNSDNAYKNISFAKLKEKSVPNEVFKQNGNIRIVKKRKFDQMSANTTGYIEYSRIIFSPKLDTARFIYNYSGSGCTNNRYGLVTAVKNKAGWKIIKNVP
jgi:hypothetical protein